MINYVIPGANEAPSGPFEVFWPLNSYKGRSCSTSFFLSGTETGFCIQIEASFSNPLSFKKRPQKGRVFEDDCLELFIRPQSSSDSFFPAPFYYGWEINAGDSLLEYRAGIGEEGRRIIGSGNGMAITDGSGAIPGVEPVHGILHDTIVGTLISFDYDWKSKAIFSSNIDGGNGLWKLDLSIPWSDFGLDEAPHGETWYFTVNRIDVSSGVEGSIAGLACLHEGITEPRFHQPSLFPSLSIR